MPIVEPNVQKSRLSRRDQRFQARQSFQSSPTSQPAFEFDITRVRSRPTNKSDKSSRPSSSTLLASRPTSRYNLSRRRLSRCSAVAVQCSADAATFEMQCCKDFRDAVKDFWRLLRRLSLCPWSTPGRRASTGRVMRAHGERSREHRRNAAWS